MKVTFDPEVGQAIVLADSENSDPALTTPIGVKGFSIGGKNNVQFLDRMRAKNSKAKNRGNLKHTIQFTSTWQFSDAAKAEQFVLSHSREIGSLEGDLEFELSAGSATFREVMHSAAMDGFNGRYIGATAIFTYVIVGGEIVASTI